jgi:single-stranded-DNA-specific exonuclease
MNHRRWKILASLKELNASGNAPYSPLIVQLLRNRGIDSAELFEPFLRGDKCLTADPFLLPDIHQAISRIYQALLRGEQIAIYGDFDTDGITATALMVEGLASMGGRTKAYIPSRFENGHGLKIGALERLKNEGISLIISVDCGTSDVVAASYARSMGLDLIITDHHTITSPLPEATAVINPKRADSSYPFRGLAGVGVAFKLLQALFRASGREELADGYLDLVALGTVSDMMPLLEDNRFLTQRGIQLLRNSTRPGLRELIKSSGLDPSKFNAEAIAWYLGPRLNAAGRVDHAILSYKLLTTRIADEACELAQLLEAKNTERQRLTTEVLSRVREQALAMMATSKILIVTGTGYHAGVHGTVANRLVDEFYRPSIVMEVGSEKSYGSARSIPEFDIIAALMDCQALLSQYGGHPGAAGFTLSSENVPHLTKRLQERANRELDTVDLRPEIAIDSEVPLSLGLVSAFQSMQELAPFGQGNPPPTFLTRGVKVVECRTLGDGGKHLRFKLRVGNTVWSAIGFDFGPFAKEITPTIDVVYTLDVDNWANQETIQLNLLDFRPATAI